MSADKSPVKCMGLPMAYVSLAVLACQNSAVALLMRFSRSDPEERQYLSSTAVRNQSIHWSVMTSPYNQITPIACAHFLESDFTYICQVLSSEFVKLVVAIILLQKVRRSFNYIRLLINSRIIFGLLG